VRGRAGRAEYVTCNTECRVHCFQRVSRSNLHSMKSIISVQLCVISSLWCLRAVAVLVKEMFLEGGDARWSLADVAKRAVKLQLSKDQIDEV
jgi:hypothetical protein